MKDLVKDVVRSIAAPVAAELVGAFRDAWAKERDAAIRARETVGALRGESEPGR